MSEFQSYIADQHARRTPTWSHAQELVQQIAEFLALATNTTPPTNLELTANALRITVTHRVAQSRNILGSLAPIPGGFQATLYRNSEATLKGQEEFGVADHRADAFARLGRRARFTLAHEFGHALFYSVPEGTRVPQRIIPAPPNRGPESWREEGLCHAFARALLVPSEWRSGIGKFASFQNLIEASGLFGVSGEALLYRILYDWKMWKKTVVLHIAFSGSQLNVRVFRGADRVGEKSFTKKRIESALRDVDDQVAAAKQLMSTLGIPRRSILVRTDSLWVLT
jgi:hypothetical protein